jgi:hypothetical protein
VCQDDVASKSLDDYIMRHYLPVAGRQPGKHDLVHAVQSVVRNLTTAASQHNCRTRCNTLIATLEGATREEYRQGHSTWKDDLILSLAWQMCSLYHLTNGERRIAQTRFFVYRSDEPKAGHTCCPGTVEAGGKGTCQQDLIQGSTMTFI